jgi:hypothetical protein
MGFIVRSKSAPYGCMKCLLAVHHLRAEEGCSGVFMVIASFHQQNLIRRSQKNQQQRELDAFFAGRSLKVRAISSIPRTPSSLRE